MKKPNILFVFADQLRYSALACNGNRVVQTPNTDRLAREGVVFDQAFSSCPICSPYRAQLLTGKYAHANGVICNEYRLFEGQTTAAHLLHEEGYRSAYIGKWHLGYPPYSEQERYGFDDMLAYNCTHRYYDVEYWHNEQGPFRMVEYAPRTETQLALDYIREHQRNAPEQPFCVFLSWGPPHWDSIGGRDYGAYPQEFHVYDPDVVDVPANVPRQMVNFAREEIADYYGMVASLDECMGKILAALEGWGLTDDTIVCFSSDHGDHLSSHGYGKPGEVWMSHTLQGSKATPHEESIHIPFLIRYPSKIKGNRRTDAMFSSVDVLPTILGLCDISVPTDLQGQDLSHVVLDKPGREPDSVFLQILGPGWPNRTKWLGLWRGVRTHDYVYARWADRDGLRVLYDLKKDPLEMHNVVGEQQYASIAENMEARLQQWLSDVSDPFDYGKRLPTTHMLDVGQVFTSPRWYESAPPDYVQAIERYRLKT